MSEYEQDGQTTVGVGRISRLFLHKMHNGDGAPEGLIADCATWYMRVGENPRNGLPQFEPNYHFNSCRMVFIRDCKPLSCILWPSDPLVEGNPGNKFDLVLHHEPAPSN